MNPSEEIVKYWLQHHGYFYESSIKVGRKEIDLLATHPFNANDKRHIEVSVSINMVDTKHTPASKAQHYLDNHFGHEDVALAVRKRFGTDAYSKELVVGNIRLSGKDAIEEFMHECRTRGIVVTPFSQILKEVTESLGTGTELNCIVKAVQLTKAFS